MAKEYARQLYKSGRWQRARGRRLSDACWICERCLAEYMDGERTLDRVNPADVVHHRRYITQRNINDTRVTLDQGNLEALCSEHHNREHKGEPPRYGFDADGNIQQRGS